jgi:hypothetical protein
MDERAAELTRLRLAQGDMRQVIAAATFLSEGRHDQYLYRALETAIVVCYARPFGRSNVVGAIGEQWEAIGKAPNLHKELLRLRNKLYAHTDKTEAREVVDVAEMFDLDSPAWTEGWHPIRPEVLPKIVALAAHLEAELGAAVEVRT